MSQKILITGGSGLVGTRLTYWLLQKGYKVAHLGRGGTTHAPNGVEQYHWNLEKGEIDVEAIATAHAIFHLAGAGVADKRWTASRKAEIIDSRVKTAALLSSALQQTPNSVACVITASAIGFYGDTGKLWVYENTPPLQPADFLSQTVQEWEKASFRIGEINSCRTVGFRIGMVLSAAGGALPELAMPIQRWGLATYFGNENLYYSWIHIDDLCKMLIFALENPNLSGLYNATAPNPVTAKQFSQSLLQTFHRKNFLVHVPSFAIRLVLGERADILLKGARTSAEKIQKVGFVFDYADLTTALQQIYT